MISKAFFQTLVVPLILFSTLGESIPFENERLIPAVEKLPRVYLRDTNAPAPAHPGLHVNEPSPVSVVKSSGPSASPYSNEPMPPPSHAPSQPSQQQQAAPTRHRLPAFPQKRRQKQQARGKGVHVSVSTQPILDICVEGRPGTVASANLSGSAAQATLADVRNVSHPWFQMRVVRGGHDC